MANDLRGLPLSLLPPDYATRSPDSAAGRVWSFKPAAGGLPDRMVFEQPRIPFGPSGLHSSTTGNMPLIGGQWNMLSTQTWDANGERAGLVAYCSQGRWGIEYGQIAISSTFPKVRFDAVVIQGVELDDDQVSRPGRRTKPFAGQPGLEVGGGGVTSPDEPNGLAMLTFCAPDIQCPPMHNGVPFMLLGQACEVMVYVFPHTHPGEVVGLALHSLPASQYGGGLSSGHASQFTMKCWNELRD